MVLCMHVRGAVQDGARIAPSKLASMGAMPRVAKFTPNHNFDRTWTNPLAGLQGTELALGGSAWLRLLMRCSGDMGLAGGGAASMQTFQRSSRATIACSTSCSTAARPRCLMVYRPPPQFRQRARSFPAVKQVSST